MASHQPIHRPSAGLTASQPGNNSQNAESPLYLGFRSSSSPGVACSVRLAGGVTRDVPAPSLAPQAIREAVAMAAADPGSFIRDVSL